MTLNSIEKLSAARLRGTSLILEKSHKTVSGKVLRHPLTLEVVAYPENMASAMAYCRLHQCSWNHPQKNVDFGALEEPI